MFSKFKCILIIFLIFSTIIQLKDLNGLYLNEKSKVSIRIDDIQDFYAWNNQLLILNYLISKNIKATLGVIPKNIGNDYLIVDAINIGIKNGLFEIALHGWSDENFSKLNYEQQLTLIKMGKEKLNTVFGNLELITFIQPYNEFNEETLKALKDQEFKVISSSLDHDPYPWKEEILKHYPQTVISADYEGRVWIPLKANSIIDLIKKSLNNYGFAVLTIHPQQFSEKIEDPNSIDRYRFEQIILVISWLIKNVEIVTIKELYESKSLNLKTRMENLTSVYEEKLNIDIINSHYFTLITAITAVIIFSVLVILKVVKKSFKFNGLSLN